MFKGRINGGPTIEMSLDLKITKRLMYCKK